MSLFNFPIALRARLDSWAWLLGPDAQSLSVTTDSANAGNSLGGDISVDWEEMELETFSNADARAFDQEALRSLNIWVHGM